MPKSLQRFRTPYAVPPGRRWFYQVPGGKFVESVFSKDDCVLRIRNAYAEIGKEPEGDVEALLEDFMCQSLPEGFCTGKPTISNPTFFTVKNATHAMVASALKEHKAGPQLMQIIDARAAACKKCKQHDLHMCITCNGLLDEFRTFRNAGRRTPHDRNIRVCRVSGGILPVVIQLDASKVKPLDGFEFPDGCWVKEELRDG